MVKPAIPLPWYFDNLIAQVALDDALLSEIRLRKYSEPGDYERAAEIRFHRNAIESDIDSLIRELGKSE